MRRAVAMKPSDPLAHVVLVQTLVGHGRDGEARAMIPEVAAKVDPERRAAQRGPGDEAVSDSEKARNYYDEALQAQPGMAVVAGRRAASQLRTNHVEGGRKPCCGMSSAMQKADSHRQDVGQAVPRPGPGQRARISAASAKRWQWRWPGRETRRRRPAAGREAPRAFASKAPSDDTDPGARAGVRPIRAFRETGHLVVQEFTDQQTSVDSGRQAHPGIALRGERSVAEGQEQLDYIVSQYPGSSSIWPSYVQLLRGTLTARRAEVELKKLEDLEKKREAGGTNAYATKDLRTASCWKKIGKRKRPSELIRKTVSRSGVRPEGGVVVLTAAAARAGKICRGLQPLRGNMARVAGQQGSVAGRPQAITVSLLHAHTIKHDRRSGGKRFSKPASRTRIHGDSGPDGAAHAPGRPATTCSAAGVTSEGARYCTREVLAKEPNNAIALNNLAWLLCRNITAGAKKGGV